MIRARPPQNAEIMLAYAGLSETGQYWSWSETSKLVSVERTSCNSAGINVDFHNHYAHPKNTVF